MPHAGSCGIQARDTIRGMPPRVSVIIATYNWSSVLPYSIGTVLRQTMVDFELLVAGDGCTDDSEQVVASIGDPRVRWINLPSNTGHQSGPNNEGLRQARGELIAYLGHDDLWLPHHLAVHVAAIDETSADMTHSLLAWVEARGDFWSVPPRPDLGAWGPPSCTVHRRSVAEALGGWRNYKEVETYPEIDLWRRARDAGYRFHFVPRLTAIKFPASVRRGVYASRPFQEQAAWSARIASEPDLEAILLSVMLAATRDPGRMAYGELVRRFINETAIRVRRRLTTWRKSQSIDDIRRFKGL
ncbi:MAG: glycosyltransferase family 2 protein [Thermoanaerobaculia bacterium]